MKLTISLVEKRTGSISAGVGYSNRQQLIGRAEVSETNFGGRGEGVNLLWETGGALILQRGTEAPARFAENAAAASIAGGLDSAVVTYEATVNGEKTILFDRIH